MGGHKHIHEASCSAGRCWGGEEKWGPLYSEPGEELFLKP